MIFYLIKKSRVLSHSSGDAGKEKLIHGALFVKLLRASQITSLNP